MHNNGHLRLKKKSKLNLNPKHIKGFHKDITYKTMYPKRIGLNVMIYPSHTAMSKVIINV